MKNLILIAVFAMLSTLTYAQKEVKVEKEIENGKEVTRVWIDGKEVKEGTAEYKKYADDEIKSNGKVWVKKRKSKKGEEEKVIIIKKEISESIIINGDEKMKIAVNVEEDGENHKVIIKKKGKNGKEEVEEIIIKGDEGNTEVIELDGDKKMMFIKVEEDIEIEGHEDGDINVDVTSEEDGKQKVIIKKKTKDGKEEVEEFIIDGDEGDNVIINGDSKVIIKTRKDIDLDLEGVNPENVETIDIKKTENGKTITIKTKDGKTIVKEIEGDTASEGKKKIIIKINKEDNFDFDLDGLDPETIEMIDVKKTDDGKVIIIKTKDGKTIKKEINGDVKVIKKEKRVKKEKD